MNEKLKILLHDLDGKNEPNSDHSISSKINEVIDAAESLEEKSEHIAFSFEENYQNHATGWGTYYGPLMVWTGDDGKVYENPSLSMLTEEIFDYWEYRSEQTDNTLMKSRYAGLVWDLKNAALGKRPNHNMALRHVNALLKVCQKDLYKYPTEAITKITRAYSVACSLNNPVLVVNCINSAMKLEKRIADDNHAGLFGFCFDLFILGKDQNITKQQQDKLIDCQESRLLRVAQNESPWVCESAGIPLATYYRSLNRQEDVKRVVTIVGKSFENACKGQAAMLASSWYQHEHDIYINYNLKEEAESVSKKIAEIGPDVIESMQSFSHQTKIPTKKLEAYLTSMVDGGIEKALHRIALQFIPKKGQIEKQVLDLAKNHPLTYLFTKTLQDHRGRPVATIGSINDDLEGNTVHQLSQNLGTEAFFLRHSFNKLLQTYDIKTEDIINFIFESPVFEDTKRELFEKGISSFLNNDYYTTIHLLVPQAEAAIRTLIELTGGATLRKNRQGGLQLRTLDDLLREKTIGECFGKDAAFYFRILLTDQRGWNIRNDVCHGIIPAGAFNYSTADRIVHIILCLAQVREQEKNA